jgi:hypothetical protein
MAVAIAIEDMRSVDPIAYIRAVGMQPEDSFGFCPNFANGSIYFAWRKH